MNSMSKYKQDGQDLVNIVQYYQGVMESDH
jgi:hypothetical protein